MEKMENKTVNVVEGAQPQMDIVPSNGSTEIVSINPNGEVEELTTGQALLGVAIIGAAGYGIGKLGELLYKKVIGPAAVKIGNKFTEKIEEEQQKKAANKKPEEGEVIEVQEVPQKKGK